MRSVAVIGGGHNGLVAAVRLAERGCRVTVLERGAETGGCLWTERHASGAIVERGAFEHGGMRRVVTELGLDVEYREHPVLAGFLFGDGERRMFYSDLDRTVAGLGMDGPAYRRLAERASALFGLLETFETPPTLTSVASALAPLAGGDALFRTMIGSAEAALDDALVDRHTRAALVLQAAHAQVPAWAPGTGMLALMLPGDHGENGLRPAGGSGALTASLIRALESRGGRVRTGAEVVRLGSDAGGGGMIALADGETLHADAVISTIGIPRTAVALTDPAPRLRSVASSLHSGQFNVGELTISLVYENGIDLGLEDRDAVHYLVADPADVHQSFAEVKAGRAPESPWAMMASVEGGGVWLSSIVPLRTTSPWTPERERSAARRVVDQACEVTGIDLRRGLVDMVVSGPATWAGRIGGDGNPSHIDNTLDQLLGWRAPGHADGRSELPWLFLAGAGHHPGGGLSGASGMTAADAVLDPRRRRDSVAHRAGRELHGLLQGFAAYRTMRRGRP
ncbi:NAD(P)/FAD-dependent oxidoreductase [Dietzia sp. B32]|uniref:phytoene desaturase family protein n=1 Tax=Dietzia sp. B32 TaxID=2915130 RepID=UPI0021AD5102|nr:NAD(P)/FAD-dependent oxidoreductase [Dietzia sp. B32]UVE94174.1 NAD(P)/FAD-dependent oxidoreductase [Dietzia sp. B32]